MECAICVRERFRVGKSPRVLEVLAARTEGKVLDVLVCERCDGDALRIANLNWEKQNGQE